eukprot:6147699-Pyramimonas_sp.AAC.1
MPTRAVDPKGGRLPPETSLQFSHRRGSRLRLPMFNPQEPDSDDCYKFPMTQPEVRTPPETSSRLKYKRSSRLVDDHDGMDI